jgi:protein-tyrosine kinase
MEMTDFLELDQVYIQTLGRGLRSVAVCAANSGEGVSTVACALAMRHQQSGRATLLVDMNLFRPSLNQRFDLARVNWQTDTSTQHQAMITILPGLDVLTASAAPANGFRQLDAIQSMIKQWLVNYDAVVFDTSPLNAINRNNIPAELICACSEGTLMVVQTAVTRQEELQQAVSRLKAYQVAVFGVVMNDVAFPTLQAELQRELRRIASRFPRLTHWLLLWIKRSPLVNIRI